MGGGWNPLISPKNWYAQCTYVLPLKLVENIFISVDARPEKALKFYLFQTKKNKAKSSFSNFFQNFLTYLEKNNDNQQLFQLGVVRRFFG